MIRKYHAQRARRSRRTIVQMTLFNVGRTTLVLWGLLFSSPLLILLWVFSRVGSWDDMALTAPLLALGLGIAFLILDLLIWAFRSITTQLLITSPVGIEYFGPNFTLRTSWNNLIAPKGNPITGKSVQLRHASLDRTRSFRVGQTLAPWVSVLGVLTGRYTYTPAIDEDKLKESIPLGIFDRRWDTGATPLGVTIRRYAPQVFGGPLPLGPTPAPDTFPPTLLPHVMRTDRRWLWGACLLAQIGVIAGAAWWSNGGNAIKTTLDTGQYNIESVAFANDGGTLSIVGSEIQVWRVPDWELLGAVDGISHFNQALSSDGTLLAVGGWRSSASLWRIAAGKGTLLRTLMPEREDSLAPDVSSIALSPDNSAVAIGMENGTLRLWSASDGQVLQTLQDNGDDTRIQLPALSEWSRLDVRAVQDVTFAPHGDWLAFYDSQSGLKLCQLATSSCAVIGPDQDGAAGLAFSPDGQRLAVGRYDGAIDLYRVGDGSRLGTLQGPDSSVSSLAFTFDGAFLASGARNGAINLWRMSDYTA